VKNSSVTYQRITKTTAVLLLMAFLIPSGLHAKQLVDFCMMEMNSHLMADTPSSHECCDSEPAEENENKHEHHDCEWGYICACDIGKSALGDEEWIPVSQKFDAQLAEKEPLAPFFTLSETIPAVQQIRIGEYDPPLWLLYDTFLN
jgi:hypothetical protein